MRNLNDARTLSQFIRNLREGVYITTSTGRILDANPAFLEMFGVDSLEQLQDYTAERLLVDPQRRTEELKILERDGAVREFELEIRRPDGHVRTVLDTCFQVSDEQTGETLFHGILVDISDRKLLEQQLRELAIRDPLTGCYNRRFLQEITAELEENDNDWGVILADIDHFKDYNDRFGHSTGDRVLVQIGRFLMQEVRAEDPVIRMGGDEFMVLLPRLESGATHEIADRLRRLGPDFAPVSFTLGWAVRQHRERLEETIRRADHLLIHVRVQERDFPPRR